MRLVWVSQVRSEGGKGKPECPRAEARIADIFVSAGLA